MSFNLQYRRICSTENPIPLHDRRVTMWCATQLILLGTLFFEEIHGFSNCHRGTPICYRIPSSLAWLLNTCWKVWLFMYNGAPPHIVNAHVKDLLNTFFGDRHVLSRDLHHAWPQFVWLLFVGLSEVQCLLQAINLVMDDKRKHLTAISLHSFKYAVQYRSQHCLSNTCIVDEWRPTFWTFIVMNMVFAEIQMFC